MGFSGGGGLTQPATIGGTVGGVNLWDSNEVGLTVSDNAVDGTSATAPFYGRYADAYADLRGILAGAGQNLDAAYGYLLSSTLAGVRHVFLGVTRDNSVFGDANGGGCIAWGDGSGGRLGALYLGHGVPANAGGQNGDFALRTDTPGVANQRLYVKSAGAWVGIL